MKKLLLLTIALFTLSGAWADDYQKLYVFGDVNGWSRTSMIEMTYDEGTQTYTYEYAPTSTVNISFSDKQLTESEATADGDWSIFNATNRYSIGSGNIVPVLGTQYTLSKYGEGNVTLEAGTYTLTVKDMNLTITGTVTPVAVTWTVAGSPESIFGTSWDPTNTSNDMVKGTDNTWTFSKEDLTLTEGNKISFKVCKNHAWGIAYPSKNYELSVPADGEYKLVITFDGNTTVSAVLENKYTVSFKNSIGWENVYAYTYGPETLGGWHGTEMNKVGDVYTISFFAATAPANIIFNDGVGNVVGESQTANLVFTDGKTYDMVSPGYYIVGNMTSDELNKDYKMTKNEGADAEEYMKIAMPLQTSNQFKVVKTTDGTNIATWYPEGTGNAYGENGEINEDGTYDIYFRPEGKAGWFENYIYVAQEISIDITENLWASYSSTKALDFSNSGLTAYIATTSNGSSVHYEPVIYVPANTGIILNGTQGTHVAVTIPSADAVGTNLLVSTANDAHEVTAGEVGDVYAFGMMGEKVGFVKALAGYTVAQGKSYLDLSTVEAKGIDFIGLPGSETDGIDTIHNAQFIMHNDAYNLAGQKVSKDYKGIVIVNGKKYLNK